MSGEFDIVVAGGGIAGLTAGLASARLGRRTLVLTGGVLGGHLVSIDSIEGYPGFPEGVPGYDLCPMAEEQAADAGAEFAAEEAVALESAGGGHWMVKTGGGEDYAANAVILATGTALKTLGVPGEERLRGKGVSQCAGCDAPLLRGRPVAVVGGGDSAMQEALTLADTVSKVTLLCRDAALSGQAAFRERVSAHANIDIRFNASVEEILGEDAVTGISVRDTGSGATETLAVDAAFVFVGLHPNTALLDGLLPLEPSGHVATDGAMRTARTGLFAAGTLRVGTPGRAVAAAGDGTAAAIAADRYLADGLWWDG